jgi:hypothetical protein
MHSVTPDLKAWKRRRMVGTSTVPSPIAAAVADRRRRTPDGEEAVLAGPAGVERAASPTARRRTPRMRTQRGREHSSWLQVALDHAKSGTSLVGPSSASA